MSEVKLKPCPLCEKTENELLELTAENKEMLEILASVDSAFKALDKSIGIKNMPVWERLWTKVKQTLSNAEGK